MSVFPNSPSDSLVEYERRLRSFVDPVGLPSVAYGVSRGQDTLLLGAFGDANKDGGVRATPKTPYSLASISKPLTAAGIALLAARGELDLDAPIDDYLGGPRLTSRAGDARLATVRRVANHSSGLPLHAQFFYSDEPYIRPPISETIRRYGKTLTVPGGRYRYSNLGYGLLDHVISQVSGRPYAEFMRDEVFLPLGMSGASIDAPADGNYARSYGPDGVAYPTYTFDHPGGSAAYASVEDLLAFGRFLLGLGPSLLSPVQLKEILRPTMATDPQRCLLLGGYGLGWASNFDRLGVGVFVHTGYMGGVSTVLRLVPELDLVIVTLSNGQSSFAGDSADEALAALLPEFRDELERERGMPAPPAAEKPLPKFVWGIWDGFVELADGKLPLRLELGPKEGRAILDGVESPIGELQFRDGEILGVFDGTIPEEDAARFPHRIHLQLTARLEAALDVSLSGACVAIARADSPGGAPGHRMGNAASFWTELRRKT